MLYILILSNKFDLKQTIRVLHNKSSLLELTLLKFKTSQVQGDSFFQNPFANLLVCDWSIFFNYPISILTNLPQLLLKTV